MRIALFAALLLSAAQATAQSLPAWQTHRWHVYCDDPSAVAVNASCDDDLPASAASAMRAQLEAFGPWVESLRFAGPNVPTDGGGSEPLGYVALLGGDRVEIDGDTVCGYYDLDGSGGRLVVGGNTTFQLEGEADYTGTTAHEAFHAIQGHYPFFEDGSAEHNWIVEGTAQAVEAAWMAHSQGVTQLGDRGSVAYYGIRRYDRPLHRPDPDDTNQLYATAHFWLGVGDLVGSPHGVQYLHDVLQRVDAETGGLGGVDAALSEMWPQGLYDLFPEFIVTHAKSGEHYDLTDVPILRVAAEAEESQETTVEPVAVRLHAVMLPDIEQRTKVTISVPDHPDLHLAVGRDRYDADDPTEAGSQRNRFESTLDQPDTLWVRVINVAPSAAASVAQDYTLTVKTEPLAGCDDGSADGLGAAVCLAVTGPQLGGIHRFGVELRRPSSLMTLGGQFRIMDTRAHGVASFRGPPFDATGLYGSHFTVTIQHTEAAEAGRRTIQLSLDATQGQLSAILGGGPYGPAIYVEGRSLAIEEVDDGRVIRGRFAGTFGGCSEGASGQRDCVRDMATGDVIDEHSVEGTFSVQTGDSGG